MTYLKEKIEKCKFPGKNRCQKARKSFQIKVKNDGDDVP